MTQRAMLLAAAAATLLSAPVAALAQGPAPQTAAAGAAADTASGTAAQDAKLTAFLDAEFTRELAARPQLATRLGLKAGKDRLDDISEAAQLQRLQARRASAARMKAEFVRERLSAKGRTNYDIWLAELDRM